jgi:hypothetical protein
MPYTASPRPKTCAARFTLRKSHFISLMCIVVALLMTTPAFAQNRRRPPASTQSKQLGEARIDPARIKINRRTPIAYKPIEMRDPKTGREIPPDEVLTLSNGKKMTAREYFTELNRLEREFNALGYTLRGPERRVKLQEVIIDRRKYEQQSRLLQSMHKSGTPPSPPNRQRFEREQQESINSAPVKIEALKETLTRKGHKFSVVRPPTKGTAKMPMVTIEALDIVPFKGPQSTKVKEWNVEIIDKNDPFYAELTGRIELQAKLDEMRLLADGKANAALFGEEFNLLHLTGDLGASLKTGKGNITVKLVDFLGNTLINIDESEDASFTKSGNLPLKPLDVHTTARFMIGPVPVSVTVGARGEIGLNYNLGVAPLSAQANLIPYVNSSIYAQAAVDIGLVKAGVEGELVLLKDEFTLSGAVSLEHKPVVSKGEPVKLFFRQAYSAHNKMTALSGSLSVFADILCPLFCDGVEFTYEIFSWPGLTKEGYLFNETIDTPINY